MKSDRLFSSFHISCLILLVCSAGGFPVSSADAASGVGRSEGRAAKNIIILLADDLGWGDVGFHGGIAETPNIDQLVAEGLELERFYAYPACSPARAAMLTGRFPHRYGIKGPVRRRDGGLPASERLLVEDFQDAGYQTALIGKWHLSHASAKESHPNRRGFDHFYGFMDASVDYFKHTSNRGGLDWQRNGEPVVETGYATDLLTNEIVLAINNRDAEQPLFVVAAYSAPHNPFQAPDDLVAKYRRKGAGRSATYAAMIDSLDQGIGKVLAAIDQQKIKDETIVVFASDNGAIGLGTNGPFRGQKRSVYEGGIRVPCVIRAPGLTQPKSKSSQLFAIHDLLPTLAAAADVSFNGTKPLDGEDLWANLISGQTVPRRMVIAEEDFAFFKNDWKLVQSESETELYDLSNDPGEERNLSETRSQLVRELSTELKEFQQRVEVDQAFSSRLIPTSVAVVAKENDAVMEGAALASAERQGDVAFGMLGNRLTESNGKGLRLMAGTDVNADSTKAGEASIISDQVNPENRWYRFDVLGMAQDNFTVDKDNLYLKVEFLQKGRDGSLDFIKTIIYPQVVQERKDLRDDRTNESLGTGIWRTYAMEFRTPFAEVDQVKLSVGFADGTGKKKRSEFWVNAMNLQPIPVPADYRSPTVGQRTLPQPEAKDLVALGGRWFFDPQGGSKDLPAQFDYRNSDQLLYKSDRYEAPFVDNMSSWLRAGYKDLAGDIVGKDRFIPDAVVITVTENEIVVKSRNLPNHPTATFPDKWRMLDGNPSYIQEQSNTWNLPKEPQLVKNPIAMDDKNANGALPMGPIGVATNGVVFFNPFDHIFETDAVWRLDRCCGHPSPQSAYHYHKYPVCVKTPWSDEGKMHSSVIGFAFDGLPVYGPYEDDGLLARDDTQNPLNDFNLHEDPVRGPHYHVTPGKFPHIIGGYWAEPTARAIRGRRSR